MIQPFIIDSKIVWHIYFQDDENLSSMNTVITQADVHESSKLPEKTQLFKSITKKYQAADLIEYDSIEEQSNVAALKPRMTKDNQVNSLV